MMTAGHVRDLPPAKRRQLIFWAALRSVLIAAVLVVLYYVLPLDRPWDSDTAIRLLIGLLIFAVVVVWGVRTIARSRYPGVRAAEAVALVIPFFLLLFASTYFVMERASAASFSQPLTRTDALYFTVTVFSTVGFGDITAKSEPARVVLIVQMLADLVVLGTVLRVLLVAIQRGRARRSEAGDDVGQATPAPSQGEPSSRLGRPGRSG
jgi:voltage-gated potassium channel